MTTETLDREQTAQNVINTAHRMRFDEESNDHYAEIQTLWRTIGEQRDNIINLTGARDHATMQIESLIDERDRLKAELSVLKSNHRDFLMGIFEEAVFEDSAEAEVVMKNYGSDSIRVDGRTYDLDITKLVCTVTDLGVID